MEKRYELAQFLAEQIRQDDAFMLLNNVDVSSVLFFYTGGRKDYNVGQLNKITAMIEEKLLESQKYHLHRTQIADPGLIEKGAILRPLRYMC